MSFAHGIRAALAAALVTLGAHAAAQQSDVPIVTGATGVTEVQLVAEPSEVEIGQPVDWVLSVSHPADAVVRIVQDELFGDAGEESSWVLLEEQVRRVLPEVPGRTLTEVHWRALALEPGEYTPEAVRVEIELADRVLSKPVPGSSVLVRAALTEGEDAPRPLSSFPSAPEAGGPGIVPFTLAALVLLAAAAVVMRHRARRRRALPPVVPTSPLQELAALVLDETQAQAWAFRASEILRAAVDTWLAEPYSGLTDDEWVARLEHDARVDDLQRVELARYLRELEPIKYAYVRPTRFALEELSARAGELLIDVERSVDAVRAEEVAA